MLDKSCVEHLVIVCYDITGNARKRCRVLSDDVIHTSKDIIFCEETSQESTSESDWLYHNKEMKKVDER